MNGARQDRKENPLVSIIVPVYNVERYLRQCLNSLVHQTLKNIELIIVNDGSTDNCPAICDEYAEHDRRIRVIHQSNGGYGKACNAGFDAAKGEYIGIIESDDFAELDMFMRLYNTAKAHDLDISRGQFDYYYSRIGVCTENAVEHVLPNVIYAPREYYPVFCMPPSVWAQIYKRHFLQENNIRFLETPGASYQDTSFTFKVYACAKRFMLSEDVLIHYRIDNENSSVNSKGKVYCVCDECAEIERFAKEKGLYDNLKYLITKMKYNTYYWNYRRLEKESALKFLKIFSLEMRKSIARKEIKRDLFEKGQLKEFNALVSNYLWFHFRQQLK